MDNWTLCKRPVLAFGQTMWLVLWFHVQTKSPVRTKRLKLFSWVSLAGVKPTPELGWMRADVWTSQLQPLMKDELRETKTSEPTVPLKNPGSDLQWTQTGGSEVGGAGAIVLLRWSDPPHPAIWSLLLAARCHSNNQQLTPVKRKPEVERCNKTQVPRL